MSWGILVGVLLVVVLIVWVARPLWQARAARQQLAVSSDNQRLENLLFEREAALLAIRDLQMDHDMGKLGDADFTELDARYRAHAIAILKELDTLGVVSDVESAAPADDSLDAWIERAVAEARQGKRRISTEGAAEA